MKDLIVIIIIVAIIFGGSFWVSNYYEKSGNEIIAIIENLSEGLEEDSYSVKKEKVDKLKDEWDKKQKIWITLQYHETINAMEDLVIECTNNYLAEEKEEFDISFDKLKRSIEDLKFREEINFVNIM